MASDIELHRKAGSTIEMNLVVKNQAGVVLTPLALTAAWFTLKTSKELADSSASLTKSIGTGITVTDPGTPGGLNVKLAPADTASLTPGVYYWDVKILEPDGDAWSVADGTLILEYGVRRGVV